MRARNPHSGDLLLTLQASLGKQNMTSTTTTTPPCRTQLRKLYRREKFLLVSSLFLWLPTFVDDERSEVARPLLQCLLDVVVCAGLTAVPACPSLTSVSLSLTSVSPVSLAVTSPARPALPLRLLRPSPPPPPLQRPH